MPAALLFDRASAVPPRRGSAGPRKQWDPGLQQFVWTTAQSTDADGRTVPRAGQRSLERSPGPGQYDLSGGENGRTGGLAGSAAFKATADRSLVNKAQAATPGVGAYEFANASLSHQSSLKEPSAAMRSKSERFEVSEQQRLTAALPSGYNGNTGYEYGSMARAAAKAARAPSSAFASSTIRDSYVPLPKGEAARILRKAEEDEERRLAWEAELQAQREADPEWRAAEAARIEAEEAEREAIEQAARDAADRVAKKEREDARAAWIAARAAEEWAWKQAEEEAEAVDAAQGNAKLRVRSKEALERQRKREDQKLGALWAWNEAEEEEGEEEEGEEGEEDGEGRWARMRRQEEEREGRIAARAAELVRQREEQMRAEAAERAEVAARDAGERAAERVRQVQTEERAAAHAEWEARMAAEAARDTDAEALKIAEAAMTAAQRAKALQEREARAEARAAERAAWEHEQSRLLAEEERAVRKAYEEARAAEKERLDAEERVRREAERERQELAIQDWSWQEAMELAWDKHEKATAAETLRIERSKIGAVKSRQKIAEERSLARSQVSRMNASGFGHTASSAAFASTASRFDAATEEAIKYVNPELRAKQRTHERMLSRSRRRADRLNSASGVLQKYARRHLAQNERKRRAWHRELDVAAPPLQALVRGWKVRSRLKWCGRIATLIQRWARGMLGRRLARWQRERVPTIQAAARGLLVRIPYRRVRNGSTAIAAGYRGMIARSVARGIRSDPVKVDAWQRLCRTRTLVDEIQTRLGELAATRAAEQSQLALALQHEHDKLGPAFSAAPAVAVMHKQEKLAISDAAEIDVGRGRVASLISLLAQVPFNRAADAMKAVAAEVSWLHELAETQSRRDELYRPASHRPKELMSLLNVDTLSRCEQLDSYRSVSPTRTPTKTPTREPPTPEPLTEEEIAAEKARRAAAARVANAGGPPRALAWNESGPQPKKWMGKGPPPPGWGKVRAMPPPPPGFKPGTAAAAAAAAAALARPTSAPKERRHGSPAPKKRAPASAAASPADKEVPGESVMEKARRMAAARVASAPASPSPAAKRHASPVPSLRTAGGGFGLAASPSASVRSGGCSSRPPSALSSIRSATSVASSSASAASAASTMSFASSIAPTGAGASARSSDSSGAVRRAVAKRKPRTQMEFEEQRLQRMARAQLAREQETLEKAKRQAQRSKRVAGYIIDPKRLEDQKKMREHEAVAKIKTGREAKAAAAKAEEEMKRQEKQQHAEKAAKAGEVALERLRARKMVERAKRAEIEREEEAMYEERAVAEEAAKAMRSEQRRLRSQTSFFARPQDGAHVGA